MWILFPKANIAGLILYSLLAEGAFAETGTCPVEKVIQQSPFPRTEGLPEASPREHRIRAPCLMQRDNLVRTLGPARPFLEDKTRELPPKTSSPLDHSGNATGDDGVAFVQQRTRFKRFVELCTRKLELVQKSAVAGFLGALVLLVIVIIIFVIVLNWKSSSPTWVPIWRANSSDSSWSMSIPLNADQVTSPGPVVSHSPEVSGGRPGFHWRDLWKQHQALPAPQHVLPQPQRMGPSTSIGPGKTVLVPRAPFATGEAIYSWGEVAYRLAYAAESLDGRWCLAISGPSDWEPILKCDSIVTESGSEEVSIVSGRGMILATLRAEQHGMSYCLTSSEGWQVYYRGVPELTRFNIVDEHGVCVGAGGPSSSCVQDVAARPAPPRRAVDCLQLSVASPTHLGLLLAGFLSVDVLRLQHHLCALASPEATLPFRSPGSPGPPA